jgi:catechol 2,3-dioxygenase-like lactoylglutathione lyase family enzyme
VIKALSHTTVWVLDQNSARRFYTEKLGFEVRDDTTMTDEYMPGTGGFRWLTVGPKQQPDLRILLAEPKPPMLDGDTAKAIRMLVAKGAFGAGVLETDDCRETYQELSKKGVQFLQEPADRPYGVEAVFRDDSGNWYSLTQRRT